MLRLQASIRRFADEYEQLAHQDARLPLEERHGWSAILALRFWEYSEFSKLRRDKPAAQTIKKSKLLAPPARAVSRRDPTRILARHLAPIDC